LIDMAGIGEGDDETILSSGQAGGGSSLMVLIVVGAIVGIGIYLWRKKKNVSI
jgi:LPXTG-motif cell wall-anchored protein